MHEAGQLVAGEERLLELRIARDLLGARVREHRLYYLLRRAFVPEDGGAILRMPVESGVQRGVSGRSCGSTQIGYGGRCRP